jgi:hypothetical protein
VVGSEEVWIDEEELRWWMKGTGLFWDEVVAWLMITNEGCVVLMDILDDGARPEES